MKNATPMMTRKPPTPTATDHSGGHEQQNITETFANMREHRLDTDDEPR